MAYKTEKGTHYHLKYGCHGATVLCGTQGLEPCLDCSAIVDKATGILRHRDTSGAAGEYRNPNTTLKDEINDVITIVSQGVAADASLEQQDALLDLLMNVFVIDGESISIEELEDVLLLADEMTEIGFVTLCDGTEAPVISEWETLSDDCKELLSTQFDWNHSLQKKHAPRVTSPEKPPMTSQVQVSINNEMPGISVELAVADVANIPVDSSYATRGNSVLVERVHQAVEEVFEQSGCPLVAKHIAEDGNPVDFLLDKINPDTNSPYTLSVKSNFGSLNKQAGQRIGQLTGEKAKEFFEHTMQYGAFPGGSRTKSPEIYQQSQNVIRGYLRDKTKQREILTAELESLFECDALLAVSHVVNGNPEAILVGKYSDFHLDATQITFVNNREQTDDWKSITFHYAGISLGEIQMHDSCDTLFKCRFNLRNLLLMLQNGTIPASYTDPPQRG